MSDLLKMDAERLSQLSAALQALDTLTHDYRLNLCPFGSIDVEVDDGAYLRLMHLDGHYYLTERYT